MTNIFEKIALDKKLSTETRRRSVALLSPPLRTSVAIGIGLAGTALLWSIASTVPIFVEGTGVMTPVSTVVTTKSLADGTVYYRFTATTMEQPAWSAPAWQFYDNPNTFNDDQVLRLANQLRELPKATRSFDKNAFYSAMVKRGTVLAQIFAPLEREKLIDAADNLIKEQASTQAQINDIQRTIRVLQSQLNSRQDYLNNIRNLEQRGYATRAVVLQEEDQVAGLRTEVLRNQSQLTQLLEHLRSARIQLRVQLSDFINRCIVFADNDLYIQEIVATPLSRVNAGDEIFITSLSSLRSPVKVPIFLAPSDATQVFPGMRVLATPAGLDRAQYGGIVGEVQWVAKLPSSSAELAARVGLPGVAGLVERRVGVPTEAVIALDRVPQNSSPGLTGGYRWSTKGQPPYRIKPGDVLDVEITTRRVRPIELVLPFLKKTFGFSPRYPKVEEKI
jgi:HlyD family secretion protein